MARVKKNIENICGTYVINLSYVLHFFPHADVVCRIASKLEFQKYSLNRGKQSTNEIEFKLACTRNEYNLFL